MWYGNKTARLERILSEFNEDSNDDLPHLGEDAEGTQPTADQYAETAYSETQYSEQPYAETAETQQYYPEQGYVEPDQAAQYVGSENVEAENNYYTSDIAEQEYATDETQNYTYEQAEPSVENQTAETYVEGGEVYSTELPSYATDNNQQYSEPNAYIQPEEYAETTETYTETTDYAQPAEAVDSDGYVAAEPYLEPNAYAAQAYSEPDYVNAPEFSETYAAQGTPAGGYVEAAQNQTEAAYDQTAYSEGGYENDGYYEQPQQTADPAYADDGQFNQATAAAQPEFNEQNFRQEYEAEAKPRSGFPTGWVVTAVGLILLLGASFYYLYDGFLANGNGTDVPVLLADKSDIKTFPAQTATSGAKNTDRLVVEPVAGTQTTDNKVGLTVNPSLLDSREEVVDQPIKSEDRIEVSDNIVADNDDRDIQNVLTLIKSSANNVEILLKPDDVDQLDQNQISIDGLETTLVNATPVKLDDLIASASQTPADDIEKVEAVNVDDLPVISEGDENPFTDVALNVNNASNVADNSDPEAAVIATELPEITSPETTIPVAITPETITPVAITPETIIIEATTPITALPEITEPIANVADIVESQPKPLPETDLSNAISIAANQSTTPLNAVDVAPKPVSRPVPQTVPDTLAPQVAAASGGAYGVQLASLPNEAAARNSYSQFANQFPNILAGYSAIIREAIIPGKGTFYRVFAGPLVSYSDANQLCASLRSAGIAGGCFARKM